MFNVSTLLLDDALKPTTPLTNSAINETLRQFAPLSDISQSNRATQLRCAGIFSDNLAHLANLPEGLYILPLFFLYFFTFFNGRLSNICFSESNGTIFTKISGLVDGWKN